MERQPYPTLSRRSVLRFLSAKGWQTKNSVDGRVTKAYLPGQTRSEEVELFFTDSTAGSDQRSEIEAAVKTISQLYDMPLNQAALAVSASAFDLIFGRIPDEYVRNDSVELRLASNYIQSMRSFLAASATTELAGERFFKRTRKEALEYAGACRFAHTFVGSFGFVIESPVGLNDSPNFPSVDEPKPFERKVVERIARGLRSYKLAVAQEDPAPIAAAEAGFSANMCDEVVGVIEDTDVSKVDLSIKFSSEWRSEFSEEQSSTFSIERRYVDLLKEAAKKLRKQEQPQLETVVGRIVRLEAEGNPSDLFEGTSEREIIISWDSGEYGLLKVQVPLTPQGYLDAVEAHKNGAVVSAHGLLKRKGRSWALDGPVDIRVLQ